MNRHKATTKGKEVKEVSKAKDPELKQKQSD